MQNPSVVVLAVVSVLGATIVLPAQAEVTIGSWGGVYTMSQQKAYADTWAGGTANFVNYPGGLGEIQAQVESGNIQWDIVDVMPVVARVGCDEDLFEKLPRDVFTPAPDGTLMDDDIMVLVPNDCVVPQIFWSYVTFYKKGTFKSKSGKPPKTIADFFDIENFPGKRGIHSWPNGLIEMALMADGVPVAEVYDVLSSDGGIDRAFAKLETIKNQVVFWSSGAKSLELVESGEVSISTAYSGRIGAAMFYKSADYVVNWDGQVVEEEWLVMLKGTPNYDEALAFLIHASAPEQQAGQAKWINYSPMRASGVDIIQAREELYSAGVDFILDLPNAGPTGVNAVIVNYDWWADNRTDVGVRFRNWMSTIVQ